MAFKKNLGFTVRCEKVMSASITQMQSYMSEAVEWPGVVDVLLWRAPFSVIFRLMESIIKKHAGKKKKGRRVIYLRSRTVKASGVSGSDGELWKLAIQRASKEFSQEVLLTGLLSL